jgi:hypothetical protein
MLSLGRNDIAPKITLRHSCFPPPSFSLPFFSSFPCSLQVFLDLFSGVTFLFTCNILYSTHFLKHF